MLTELNWSHVENAIVFYYIHMILHILLALAMSTCGLFVHFCYTKVTLPKLLEEPHQSVLNFHKGFFWLEENCALQLPGQVV